MRKINKLAREKFIKCNQKKANATLNKSTVTNTCDQELLSIRCFTNIHASGYYIEHHLLDFVKINNNIARWSYYRH